jgi:16S rRNA processing protein RimM
MVKVEVLTDFPERFAQAEAFYVGEDHRLVHLERSAGHKGSLLLKFAGYETPEACAELRDQVIYIPIEEAMPLPEGEYYIYQIVGLDVWTDEGERLGRLTEVWETGANDVYVIDRDGKNVLLPAIPDVVQEIDLEQGRITVHVLDGLMP